MGILFEDSTTYVWKTNLKIFFCFNVNFLANGGVLTTFNMLAENFVISSRCVVTYPNITSDKNTVMRYKTVQEITLGHVKQITAELANFIFIIKFKIWLQA